MRRMILVMTLLAATMASAQSLEMRIPGADPKQPHPVSLAKADVSAVIAGGLSRTSMTLTFENAADRVLEGELVFPLPEGATVCAYALDVNGQLVDAVTIEKDKARISFETEVRRGIDPGIVEKVQGNNFRTRVYPIPAKGSRTIRVEYVSELIGGQGGSLAYQLPLKWSSPVRQMNLRVEVVKTTEAPRTDARGLADFTFKQWEDRFVAEQQLENVKLDASISVALPPIPAEQVIVEKRVKAIHSLENLADVKVIERPTRAEHYFVINDVPPPTGGYAMAKPRRIGVVWDASLSRADADHKRELALLEKHLKAAGAPADLIVLRNVAELPVTFDSPQKLIEHLKTIPYDGGTSLSSLRILKNNASYWPAREQDKSLPDYAYFLLFTDGLSNLGADVPGAVEVPVYPVSNDPRSNHAALSQIARTSGGAYANLQRMSDEQCLTAIGVTPFSLLSIEHNENEIADVYPRTPLPLTAGGRFAITGKLLAKQAKVTLNYGRAGQITHSVPVTISQDGAEEGLGVVARFWAQAKVAELSGWPDRYESEITQLGKEFGLVTPFTSMIVLETVEQYLRHKIVPPKSRGQIYAQFMERIEQQRVASSNDEKAKIDRVVQMWDARVAWWENQYAYPKDFKYAQAAGAKDVLARNGTSVGVRILSEAPAPAAPAVPAPAPTTGAKSEGVREPAEELGQRGAQVQLAEQAIDALRAEQERRAARPADPEGRSSAGGRGGGGRGGGGGLFGGSGGEAGGAGPSPSSSTSGRTPQRGRPAADGAGPNDSDLDARSGFMSFGKSLDYGNATGGTGIPDALPGIRMKEWSPDAPYLKALAANVHTSYQTYLKQRAEYGSSPAFYLDCSDFFAKTNQTDLALRILTNIPELALDDGRLIRIAAHRLQQLGHLDLAIDLFEKVTKLRPEEPQSFRDLALALAQRAERHDIDAQWPIGKTPPSPVTDYQRALNLLHKVVMNPWHRFEEIEVLALMEANRILAKAAPLGTVKNPFDPRLTKLLDLDLRIVMTWDTDSTDIDLHVVEPSGETAYYSHSRTTIGGLVSKDFTQGYGPEEYCLRKLMPGRYQIKAHFYGSRDQKLFGPTTLQATIITNFGRPDEKRQAITLRLKDSKDWVEIGSVTLGEPK